MKKGPQQPQPGLNRRAAIFLIILALLSFYVEVFAAPGDIDLSFDAGSGLDDTVLTIAVQADSKIVIGGIFNTTKNIVRNKIARLNQDGSTDTSFNAGTGPNSSVNTVALQPDGKILLGGSFTSVNGAPCNFIARLNPDGSLDFSFSLGSGPNSIIRSLALLPDGKILIAGDFTNVSGSSRNRIARLNSDGTLDTSFAPGSGASARITAITSEADGKVFIGGEFTLYNGITRNRVARLNSDGNLDTAFNPGTGPNGSIASIIPLENNQIIIAGIFSTFNGGAPSYIARLNTDGSVDNTFTPSVNSFIRSAALQADGKIVIGGEFTVVNGVLRQRLARLNANGTHDSSFSAGTGVNVGVQSVAVQDDGKVLLGGRFTTVNGATRFRLARCNPDGTLDTAFSSGDPANAAVRIAITQPDNKVIAGGDFTSFRGVTRNRIARLLSDGSLDSTFNPGAGPNSFVETIALQQDGKVLIGGDFSSVSGVTRFRIARLNNDGTLDTTFVPGLNANSLVQSIVVLSDGKLLVGGNFTTANGATRNYLARLTSNGSLDSTFTPVINSMVRSVALQPNGRILIGGDFTIVNGVSQNRIARLESDGSLDSSFNPGSGANGFIESLALQTDGKIIICGNFGLFDSAQRTYIARLNSDGSLDASFSPLVNGLVRTFAVQPAGNILIGGDFTSVNGLTQNRIALINSDGTLNPTFTLNSGANASVWSISLQADGKAMVAGTFTSVGNSSMWFVARLHSDPLNTPPSNLALNNNSIAENLSASTLIGDFFATDSDPEDTHSFSLVSGEGDSDNASFVIEDNSLKAVGTFDYEVKSSYSIRVRATDSAEGIFEKALTIWILDLNEPPVLVRDLVAQTTTYGASISYLIPVDTFSDPDQGQILTYSISGLPPGLAMDATNRRISGSPAQAGAFTITVTATDDAISPLSASTSFSITVQPAALIVTANDQSKPYGAALPPLSVTYSGFVLGDDALTLSGSLQFNTSANASSSVGNYGVAPFGLSSPNYLITYQPGTILITPVAINITTESLQRAYGTANPPLNAGIAGLQNGDNISVTCATSANESSPVGTYPIVSTVSDPDGKLSNYIISSTPGTLTVTPAPLRVRADNKSRVYGAANPTFTANYAGLRNGDEFGVTFTCDVNSSTFIGSYAIIPAIHDQNEKLGNYSLELVNGALSITAAPLEVTIDSPESGSLHLINTPVTFSGGFTFTGYDGAYSAQWTISNASWPEINIPATITVSSISNQIQFPAPGVYSITLTVQDPSGAITATTLVHNEFPAQVVIYDPEGGFITGKGTIRSPKGAFHPGLQEYASIEGKADFNFLVKYQNGGQAPSGNADFKFKAANMILESTAYQWLVLEGAQAQFKGYGTINGQGIYSFIVTVIAGQGGNDPDGFRIKIWHDETATLIYDNVPGADLSATSVLQSGNIVLHSEK